MNDEKKVQTKKCQYCQTDIPMAASVCPNCKGKQGDFIKKHPVMFVLLILFAICAVGAIINGVKEANFKKDYTQSETVTYKEVNYSITNVEKTEYENDFSSAPEGYEYVKVTMKIENKSNKKISYNPLDFKMINADGQETEYDFYVGADTEKELHSGSLAAGGTVEGYIVWKQKKNDNNLRVRYYKNALFDDEYTFQWKLD